MIPTFSPDIFSDPVPKWTGGSIENLGSLIKYLPEGFGKNLMVEYAGGLEINSNNFKLTENGKSIIVKRWSKASEQKQLERILNTMDWLESSGMEVPKPIEFADGNLLLSQGGYNWSCYPYFSGNYFSGKDYEISNAAQMTARLANTLSNLSAELIPEAGPKHLTDEDNETLTSTDRKRDDWESFFGTEYAVMLENSWVDIMNVWARLKKNRVNAGPSMAVHFDLHPHNLIFKGSEVSAILDFEACKVMPVGYAIAFAGLKQCRQAVSFCGDSSLANKIGKNYIQTISSNIEFENAWIENFSDLALAEIMRRICIILKLNLQGNKDWNKVLHVQIAHLYEAKALFEKN
jgi:Ser/Thr protein kinase RdoA (MazF antagonist)